MNKFWKFENKVSSEGASTLYLDGDISSVTWWGDEVTPEEFRSELRQMKGDLTVHINSQGGDVFAGVTIYNALKDYGKGKVTVKVDGLAASIASVVAMAGDEIIMSPGSMMMVHNPWSMGVGNSDELRKAADTLDEIKEAILPIYTDRSGLSTEEVQELMDNETWMTAEKAVELGFADTVQKAKVEQPKEEKADSVTNLMMANFAFSMSATKSAMKDLIQKVNNSERDTQMNEDELKKTEAEVEVAETETEAEVEETVVEVKDSCAETECEKTEEAEEEKTEEAEEEKAEDTNTEEGEDAKEEAEPEGEDIADKVEARIKALQDENAKLKDEIAALKDAKASAEAKASAQDELQARLTAVLNMAEQADGGEVAGEKEDKKPVDTYGDALAEAFKEMN